MAKNTEFLQKNRKIIYIYGYHSVKAALENNNRKKKRLILSQNSAAVYYEQFKKKIKQIEVIPKKIFDKKYINAENNQGMILEAYNFPKKTINDILKNINEIKNIVLIILDQVNDPQNIGSIMRSAALFNCPAIILSEANSPEMNSTIIKTASGGAETVDLIKVPNIARCIDQLKENNFWIVGLDSESVNTINKLDMPKKCVFVLGSEKSGLRKLSKKKCDFIVSINSKKDKIYGIDSLNVSNAASIALYEYNKTRN